MVQATEPATKLVKPRTKAGKRALEKRAPKLVRRRRRRFCCRVCCCRRTPCRRRFCPRCLRLRDASLRRRLRRAAAPTPLHRPPAQVEDPRRALLVYGNRTSQVIKDVMTDLHKLKGVR